MPTPFIFELRGPNQSGRSSMLVAMANQHLHAQWGIGCIVVPNRNAVIESERRFIHWDVSFVTPSTLTHEFLKPLRLIGVDMDDHIRTADVVNMLKERMSDHPTPSQIVVVCHESWPGRFTN